MKKKLKNILWLFALFVCIGVLIFSAIKLYDYLSEREEINEANEEIIATYTETGTEDGTDDFSIDWDSLLATNSDIVAWIRIPDTNISFPVVQGDTNNTYLRRSIYKIYSKSGCIFIDSSNSSDFSDLNTVIYGHNLGNGTMFSNLKKYKSESYASEHNTIYIYFPSGEVWEYKIFAFGKVKATNSTVYNTSVTDLTDYYSAISGYNQLSLYNELDTSKSVITLSTCTNGNEDDRYVVQAYLETKN